MTLCIEQEMHVIHREWMSENLLRRSEIRNWQYEFYQLTSELPKLQNAIKCHEAALADHAMHVRLYDAQLAEQEHALVVGLDQSGDNHMSDLTKRITLEECGHQQHADRHDLLRLHHYEVLKHWRALMKALDHCEFPPQG
jgi:hypothetical protein